jgi:hypothetical protein
LRLTKQVMSEHLSREEIDNYIARKLAPTELLRVDGHLAACSECMNKLNPRTSLETVREQIFAAEAESHLSFETMSQLVDGRLNEIEREIADLHMQNCGKCFADVEELRTVREALKTDLAEAKTVAAGKTGRKPSFSPWAWLIPAAAIVVIGALFWLLSTGGRTEENLANASNSAVVANNNANVEIATNEIPHSNVDQNSDTGLVVTAIKDAGGQIEMLRDGQIRGLDSGQFEQKVRAALTDGAVTVSPDARELRSSSGTLMGSSTAAEGFRLIGPMGRVVEMDSPPFRWQPLNGAASYKVGVYNESFQLVAESPELKATAWTPNVSLPRGRVYQWQVTATVDGKEVVSPKRPAPDAKFKVVDAVHANEIQQARRTAGNSHLLMGIVYANAGMVAEAQREFQALLQKNPNSEIAKKLIAKVRTPR